MKYSILIFSAALLLSSCNNKKADEPKSQAPDTTNNFATDQKSHIDNMDKNAMKNHKSALDALINLPGGGPIPPHFLPVRDKKLLKETDSTATYDLTSSNGGMRAKVEMKRRITGQDTTWLVLSTEEHQ